MILQSMKTLTEIRNELIRVDKELHKELHQSQLRGKVVFNNQRPQ